MTFLLEPQNGIEPSSSEWQSDVLTVVLLRHFQRAFQLYQIYFACQQLFYLFLKLKREFETPLRILKIAPLLHHYLL